jgi:hypothetical protein
MINTISKFHHADLDNSGFLTAFLPAGPKAVAEMVVPYCEMFPLNQLSALYIDFYYR